MKITLSWAEATQAILNGLGAKGKLKYKGLYKTTPRFIRNEEENITDIQIEIEESNKEKK